MTRAAKERVALVAGIALAAGMSTQTYRAYEAIGVNPFTSVDVLLGFVAYSIPIVAPATVADRSPFAHSMCMARGNVAASCAGRSGRGVGSGQGTAVLNTPEQIARELKDGIAVAEGAPE